MCVVVCLCVLIRVGVRVTLECLCVYELALGLREGGHTQHWLDKPVLSSSVSWHGFLEIISPIDAYGYDFYHFSQNQTNFIHLDCLLGMSRTRMLAEQGWFRSKCVSILLNRGVDRIIQNIFRSIDWLIHTSKHEIETTLSKERDVREYTVDESNLNFGVAHTQGIEDVHTDTNLLVWGQNHFQRHSFCLVGRQWIRRPCCNLSIYLSIILWGTRKDSAPPDTIVKASMKKYACMHIYLIDGDDDDASRTMKPRRKLRIKLNAPPWFICVCHLSHANIGYTHQSAVMVILSFMSFCIDWYGYGQTEKET